MGASARPHQLLTQCSEGLLLGTLNAHRADLKLLQHRPSDGELQRGLSDGSRQLLQQGGLTSTGSIEAGVAGQTDACFLLAPGDAHQPHPIAQVVLQGTGDAAEQIRIKALATAAVDKGKSKQRAGTSSRHDEKTNRSAPFNVYLMITIGWARGLGDPAKYEKPTRSPSEGIGPYTL